MASQINREMCYRCFWPKRLCWCSSVTAIETNTKIVILMHPKEFKHMKAATGRFTHLCLKNSEIHMGIGFDEHHAVQALIHNPRYFPMLLYPCKGAVNISQEGLSKTFMGDRQLLIFLLDATWRLARRMFNTSQSLQKLPRIMFVPEQKSRFIIKKQPHEWCLSTIEAAHELMRALEKAEIDSYDRPTQMLELFARMQDYQISCIQDPALHRYRRHAHGVI
jgi:DTW domain-containing protein